MNLVRWFRKNNSKIMAVVVVVIMVGFVGGSALTKLLQVNPNKPKQIVASFLDDKKITREDLRQAQFELDILTMLSTPQLLRSLSDPLLRTIDLRSMMLGELLFTDRSTSAIAYQQIKQTIMSSDFRITDKQINDIYNQRTLPSHYYWLMLTKEAELAGLSIPNEHAKRYLANIIPRLLSTQQYPVTYQQAVGWIVRDKAIPESKILATFAKLLAILDYARIVTTGENITTQQIKHNLASTQETFDLEFVKFEATYFLDQQKEPSEKQIAEHFDKYKSFLPGDITTENPYGFGYKLPERARLEYAVVMVGDTEAIIDIPTEQDAEEYYQKRAGDFTRKVLSDPNDPNSPQIDKRRSYAEVAVLIRNGLLQERKNKKAKQILLELKNLSEPDLTELETSQIDKLTQEQLKEKAGDYTAICRQLSEKYGIDIYSGQTGLLGEMDMVSDIFIRSLFIEGGLNQPIGLTRIVMATPDLNVSELGPFDVTRPALYENIGPFSDYIQQKMVVVRITETKKATEPESIDAKYSKGTIRIDNDLDPKSDDQKLFSVRENVVEDLKMIGAMQAAKTIAEEFKAAVEKLDPNEENWQSIVDSFNRIHQDPNLTIPDDPNTVGPELPEDITGPFRLQDSNGLRRIPQTAFEAMLLQNQGDPTRNLMIERTRSQKLFLDKIYELVPPNSNSPQNLPLVLESKSDMSCYCLKNVVINRTTIADYDKLKIVRAYRDDYIQSQSLTVVHFNPENILKRMKMEFVERDDRPVDANKPEDSNDSRETP
ncbi:MAG: hypothetical protein ACYSWP_03935 [Planctomycetota bacterium]|jgi:hypothetical protein